jgi:hypothetical protein
VHVRRQAVLHEAGDAGLGEGGGEGHGHHLR